MNPETDDQAGGSQPPHPGRWTRWLWFIGLWAGSVLALGLVAALMRGFMNVIGLGK